MRRLLANAFPAVVALLALTCFLPSLGNDFVFWDDDLNFTQNPHYRGLAWGNLRWMFTTTLGGHYQPLSWVTLGLDYTLWGMNPLGYHLSNAVLHAANAVLAYHLSLALLRRAELAVPLHAAAALSALLFAVHPLRVESVAWISERRDVLSGFFYMATILAYLQAQGDAPRRGWYGVSLACFVASLLSKAWGITLPVVLLALDAYPLRRWRRERLGSLLWEKAPYVVLAGAAAAIAAIAQVAVPEARTMSDHGLLARLAQAAYGLCFYLAKTLLPVGLSPLYLLEPHLDPFAFRYVLAAVAVALLTLLALLAWRRAPWLTVAWVCYAAILSPVLGILQTGPQLVADRYTYLACVPWAVVVAALVGRFAGSGGRVAWGTAAASLLLLAVLTVRQTAVWHDSLTLWNHVLALDPENHIAYTNRGWARQVDGDLASAISDYTRAAAIAPRYALARYNRGTAHQAEGDLEGAIADYDAATRLAPSDPRAFANRGWARHDRGDLDGAIADYGHALAIAPPDWSYRAMIQQRLDEATGARHRP